MFCSSQLFGLGIANICGSFFSSYPATGSFSRSAVNHESGAKTGLSGIIMGIIIGGALLFMTPLFTDIPQVRLHMSCLFDSTLLSIGSM
jgi:sulfate transporter 4